MSCRKGTNSLRGVGRKDSWRIWVEEDGKRLGAWDGEEEGLGIGEEG